MTTDFLAARDEAFHVQENEKAAAIYEAARQSSETIQASEYCLLMVIGTLIDDLNAGGHFGSFEDVLHAVRLSALEAGRARARDALFTKKGSQ